ncbi:MAG: 50S ribosomal protein L13 [Oscillospiraceae bacterium]|nr:50S ribosomal protein L13 [Oscillospiraceae bacterium]
MSTYMAKNESIERKWYIIDAEGKPLGRVATLAASILRGKHKPIYTPHVDCGDFVIVTNIDKIVLTGNKLTQKYYRRHSGWVGGLHETQYKKIMAEKPEFAVEQAVKGMLGKNTLGREQIKRVKCFRGPEHNHQAQQPVASPWEVK